METITHTLISKSGKAVLLVAPDNIEWPSIHTEQFGTYCGPGGGVGDAIVPDTIWGLKVSAACFCHDFMWQVCDPTWADFHYSNSVFFRNLLSIIATDAGLIKYLRCYRAVTYYIAVDTAYKIFWKAKGCDVPITTSNGFSC